MSSLEIEISTSDTASEWLSVEMEVFRYPKRPGSSSGDDVVEYGAIRRMGSTDKVIEPHVLLAQCRLYERSTFLNVVGRLCRRHATLNASVEQPSASAGHGS